MSGDRPADGPLDGTGLAIGIVCARFNGEITEELLTAATKALVAHGVADDAIATYRVPGAFELPVAAQRLAHSGRYDAVIALGAVIRGETAHFELVAQNAAAGIARVALDSGVPVIFGVLATDTPEQARDRTGGAHGNSGEAAALAAIEMASVLGEMPSRR
jgi:6,7-dimethyl-8-ribityllumazine synthase